MNNTTNWFSRGVAICALTIGITSCANPAASKSIYLKCVYDNKVNFDQVIINPDKETGTVTLYSKLKTGGFEAGESWKAQQFISSDFYKLKYVGLGEYGWTRTWSISRIDGAFSATNVFTNNKFNQPGLSYKGTCKKTKRPKTLF